jgi:thioredoxin-related protein
MSYSPRFKISLALVFIIFAFAANATIKNYWYINPYGFEQVKKRAAEEGEPFVIFIYTDWCGFCAKLNKDYLSNYKVRKVLSKSYLVKINPETSNKHKAISDQFGTKGYPNFRIVYPNGQTVKMHPFKKNGNDWTAEEFAIRLDKALSKS